MINFTEITEDRKLPEVLREHDRRIAQHPAMKYFKLLQEARDLILLKQGGRQDAITLRLDALLTSISHNIVDDGLKDFLEIEKSQRSPKNF